MLLLLLAPPLTAQKVDVIYLANGDRIRGEIKRLERGRMEYKTDDLGTVSVKWEKIDEVESPRFFEVASSAGVRRYGSLGRAGLPGFVVVRGASADTIPLSFIVMITPINASFLSRLDGYLDFGYSLTRADNQHELTLQGKIRYRGRMLSSRLPGQSYSRSRSAGQTSRNDFSFSLERRFQKRRAAWVIGQGQQHDELQLDLRTLVAIGPAHEFVRTNAMDFTVGLSGFYTRDSRPPDPATPKDDYSMSTTLGWIL